MITNPKKSDKAWTRERKQELDSLLTFSNSKIESMEARGIADLAYNCRLFEGDQSWQSFIFRSITREPDPADLVRRKRSLQELQRHFKERLEEILLAVKTGSPAPILEVTGTTIFTVYPAKDRFLLDLKNDDNQGDALKREKAKLDLRFLDLVRILGLTPGRFGRCQRPACGHIFCQSSFKRKNYCSSKCGNAHRQEKFQKKLAYRDLREGSVIAAGEEVVNQSSTVGDSKT